MRKSVITFLVIIMSVFFVSNVFAFGTSVEAMIGGHIYSSNEFLDQFNSANFRQADFSNPSANCEIPAGELNVIVRPDERFAFSVMTGTYIGGEWDYAGITRAQAHTIYSLVAPRLYFPFDISSAKVRPYMGFGVGMAWYSFYYVDGDDTVIDNNKFDSLLFAYAPVVGCEVPVISNDTVEMYIATSYKYLMTTHKNHKDYDAGGHIFMIGLGASF